MENEVIDWLLGSDPSIIFQTKRDLLDLPKPEWNHDQQNIMTRGWGKQLLDLQNEDGQWDSGLYTPKFTSTHYTLLLLRRMELLPNEQTDKGCNQLIKINAIGNTDITDLRQDVCITGMGLGILAHFQQSTENYPEIVKFLQHRQLEDGGWNCRHPRIKTMHSSLNTTLSVLEGLAILARNFFGFKNEIIELQNAAHEFLLVHELFKSHRTGNTIHPQFTDISFPPRWKYNILSALDYFQSSNVPYDTRMDAAINLIKDKRKNGGWLKGKQMIGKEHFPLNLPKQPSEFNTLRVLRVLKNYDHL